MAEAAAVKQVADDHQRRRREAPSQADSAPGTSEPDPLALLHGAVGNAAVARLVASSRGANPWPPPAVAPSPSPHPLLMLQRAVGNVAVARLVAPSQAVNARPPRAAVLNRPPPQRNPVPAAEPLVPAVSDAPVPSASAGPAPVKEHSASARPAPTPPPVPPPGDPATATVQRWEWPSVSGVVDAVAGGLDAVRQRALRAVSGFARNLPGYGLLCVALGRDVITQQPVTRTATAVIGALVGLIPGGQVLWRNLQESGAVERAAEWFHAEVARLGLTWESIRASFSRAWDSFGIADFANPSGLWGRLAGILGPPLQRLRDFAVSAAKKLAEFVFEGVLNRAGGSHVMGILRRAGDVISSIVERPVAFAGNLVRAVQGGLRQFSANILNHLRNGLFAWLTGAMRGAIAIPARLDWAGILSFVLNLLGLTWSWLRQRLVRTLTEPVVRRVETAVSWVQTVVTGGIAAVAQRLSDMASGFMETIIGGIRDWVARTVVGAAITRLVSMFNPAGAVIQAILAIYNTVQFFVERAQQLGALAESVFTSIGTIAAGNIGGAANAVEQALSRAVPVVLGFLARLIGLGDVATPVRNVVTRLRGMVDRAADRVVGWIAAAGRRLLGALRGGRPGQPGQDAAAGQGDDIAPAVRDATGMLNASGATEASVRAGLPGLRQRHRLRSAELAPAAAPGTFEIRVQRSSGATEPTALGVGPQVEEARAIIGQRVLVRSDTDQKEYLAVVSEVRRASESSAEMVVVCTFDRTVETRHRNPHSEPARLVLIGAFLASMRGGHTVVKPFTGGDHKSKYAQVDGDTPTGYSLAIGFRRRWRSLFYPRGYSATVLAHKAKVVGDNTHPQDLNKPAEQRRWRWNGTWYVNAPDTPGEATVDHNPPVVAHFKTVGSNVSQPAREEWYREGGDDRPPEIMPRGANSSLGSDGERADPWTIGPDFRGPGDAA